MTALRVSPDLTLPLDVASQAVAILGIRGAGKTNTATVMAEELLTQHQPCVVLDPTDAWWGLRSGYPVFIFGGTHGDLPLQETDGKVLAEFVVSERVPVVLSMRHLRKNAQRRFVTEFCEEIYHLKGKPENRTPLTVFIDEAPLFVPQKVMGETARTVGAVEDLIARGRNAGFGVVLISQRSATINKDVLTQCDTIVTHRLTSPQDRKALNDWIEENATIEKQKEILSSLATLPNGRAWVWAPRLDVMKQIQIRLRSTFDSSATPKRGEQPAQPKRLEEVDLGKLKERLASTVEKAKQDDPKLLRQEIARLKGLVFQTNADTPRIDPAALEQEYRRGHADGVEQMRLRLETLASAIDGLHSAAAAVQAHFDSFQRGDASPLQHYTPPARPQPQFRPAPVVKGSVGGSGTPRAGDPAIGNSGLRRILIALAQRPQGLTQRQLGLRATMSSRSGTFATYLSKARTNGWIEGTGHLRITDAGLRALGSYEPLPEGRALLEHWLGELGESGAARILRALANAYPKRLTQEEIGRAADLSERSGTFATYLSKLRTLELIEGRGELRASEELFG